MTNNESVSPAESGERRHTRDAFGRYTVPASTTARIDALRADLAAARGLPLAWREQLLTELALALDAAGQHLGLIAGGLLTRKGRIRAPYRAYLEIADRIATIVRQLGLDDDAKPAPLSPDQLIRNIEAAARAASAKREEAL